MSDAAPVLIKETTIPAGTLKIRNVSKAFPNVQALDNVSLDIRPGEILAFIGENGAGKSTLLKIINGDYQADVGSMSIDDKTLNFSNPKDAHEAGVRVIYQEPEIIPGVDVAENIWVGELPKRFGFIDRRQLNEQVRASLNEYGFEKVLPMGLMGNELSTAQAQIVPLRGQTVTMLLMSSSSKSSSMFSSSSSRSSRSESSSSIILVRTSVCCSSRVRNSRSLKISSALVFSPCPDTSTIDAAILST